MQKLETRLEQLEEVILEERYKINLIDIEENISFNHTLRKFPRNINYEYNYNMNKNYPMILNCNNNGYMTDGRLVICTIVYYVVEQYSKLNTNRIKGLYNCIFNEEISKSIDNILYTMISSKEMEEEIGNPSFYNLIKLLCVYNLILYYNKDESIINDKKTLLSIEYMMKYFTVENMFTKKGSIFGKVYEKDTEYLISKIKEIAEVQ